MGGVNSIARRISPGIISSQCHFTSTPHRCHPGFTSVSLQIYNDATKRFVSPFNGMSEKNCMSFFVHFEPFGFQPHLAILLRSRFDVISISLRFHIDIISN